MLCLHCGLAVLFLGQTLVAREMACHGGVRHRKPKDEVDSLSDSEEMGRVSPASQGRLLSEIILVSSLPATHTAIDSKVRWKEVEFRDRLLI